MQTPVLHNGKIEIAIISLPIRRFSRAYFIPGQRNQNTLETAGRSKCKKVISSYLKSHKLKLPIGNWVFFSELERSCGMASSTADMVAILRCLDSIFSRKSSTAEIADFLRPIERSDSVFLDSYTLYLSAQQKLVRLMPGNFQFHVYYIDEGYTVDTAGVTPCLISHYRENFNSYN